MNLKSRVLLGASLGTMKGIQLVFSVCYLFWNLGGLASHAPLKEHTPPARAAEAGQMNSLQTSTAESMASRILNNQGLSPPINLGL